MLSKLQREQEKHIRRIRAEIKKIIGRDIDLKEIGIIPVKKPTETDIITLKNISPQWLKEKVRKLPVMKQVNSEPKLERPGKHKPNTKAKITAVIPKHHKTNESNPKKQAEEKQNKIRKIKKKPPKKSKEEIAKIRSIAAKKYWESLTEDEKKERIEKLRLGSKRAKQERERLFASLTPEEQEQILGKKKADRQAKRRQWWDALNPEEKAEIKRKISDAAKKRWAAMSNEEKEEILEKLRDGRERKRALNERLLQKEEEYDLSSNDYDKQEETLDDIVDNIDSYDDIEDYNDYFIGETIYDEINNEDEEEIPPYVIGETTYDEINNEDEEYIPFPDEPSSYDEVPADYEPAADDEYTVLDTVIDMLENYSPNPKERNGTYKLSCAEELLEEIYSAIDADGRNAIAKHFEQNGGDIINGVQTMLTSSDTAVINAMLKRVESYLYNRPMSVEERMDWDEDNAWIELEDEDPLMPF